jgi:acyl-CoA reductase-like NAD-dependent aldehyde dehydrogenase
MRTLACGALRNTVGGSARLARKLGYAAHAMTSPQFPEPPAPLPPTPLADVDALVDRLAEKKDEWVRVPPPKRVELLRRCMPLLLSVADDWVRDGCRAKGIDVASPLAGEEWVAGPWQTMRNLRLFAEALEAGGQPRPPKMTTRADGRTVVKVFPTNLHDRALFSGFSGEVWLAKGQPATQGATYRVPPTTGKVALVLGAGNVSSIGPMDVLYKLMVDNEVVILKTNPVNAWVGPHLSRALAPFIEDGYLAIVHGGGDVGAHLANHPKIDTLHVTGSDKTYDAIVWGADPAERERRKASNEPLNKRPFSAELGCVTPVLVVPGPWSAADMRFQARQVAGMVAQNASFNCNAAKVLVLSRGWLQRETFLRFVEEELARTAPRKAYYPGAEDRYEGFIRSYPQAKAVGAKGEGVVPWTVIPDVPAEKGEYALTQEAFCGVLAEVALDANGPADFLDKATVFANESCWGTLSCCVLVHPATFDEHRAAFERAIEGLRYGGIGINCWPAMVYGLVTTTWGAYPGHTPRDIQSGSGVVHNSFMFDHPEKSIARAPFRIWPTPAWFADHKNLANVGRELVKMEAAPSWGQLFKVAREAVKG